MEDIMRLRKEGVLIKEQNLFLILVIFTIRYLIRVTIQIVK